MKQRPAPLKGVPYQIQIPYSKFRLLQQRREGGGTPERSLPPKSEKLLQKSGVIFQRYIVSERSQKSKKYLAKNCEKSQFSIEILIKKSQNVIENFQYSLHFWSKRARFCRQVAYFYLSSGNLSSNLNEHAFFYKFNQIFSKNFKNFHANFNNPYLFQLFLKAFYINFSIRYQNSQRISLDLQDIIKSENLK